MTTTPTATTLSAYGEELIAACRAYSDAALAVKDDDKDDGARTEPPTAGVPSTRGCIDACARIDAEGTKVGLFFRDDGEDVDDAGARSLLAALHDAHVAFTLECAAVLEMNKFGTCFADALRAASRGMTQAVCNAMSSASAETGDGRSAATKRAVGEIWASTEAFKALPKSASAAVARELMRMATFVKDVSSELEELEELGGADDVGLDEDDLRFCDDDFDASELAIGKSIGAFAKACLVLLKALIVPMVKEKTTDLKALEPCVEACGRFRQSVEDLGAGVYPPQDTDELKESLAQAVKSAREMYACVREAGAGDDETKDALDVFVAASEVAEKALE